MDAVTDYDEEAKAVDKEEATATNKDDDEAEHASEEGHARENTSVQLAFDMPTSRENTSVQLSDNFTATVMV